MRQPPDDDVDIARRALLRRIGLGVGLAYVAPTFAGLDVARASGGSRGGSRPSRPSGPSRPAARQARQPARLPPPELVALVPLNQPLDAAVTAGFAVLSETEVTTLSARVARFSLPPDRELAGAIAELASLLPGAVTDANHLYTPDDFLCDGADCAAHAMIGWSGSSGWAGASRARLGMIDTGINTDHPALIDQRLRVHQIDLGDRNAAGRQHGTAIAAILVGGVKGRVPGLLPDAELIAVEAFHTTGLREQADAFSIVAAFDVLIGDGVDVINLSLSGPANAVVRRMTTRADEAGIGLVAAVGNDGPGADPAYPAAWPEVIAVTAVDARRRPYRRANQGAYVTLAAPGVNIWTAASISGGRLRSGTSYATPFVTAALAVERLRTPGNDTALATQALLACAQDLGEAGHDPVFGNGLLAAPGQCSASERFFSTSGE